MENLVESDVFTYEIIEDAGDGSRLRLRGIYQLSDTKNRNRRVYPRGLWEKVLSNNGDFNRRLGSRLVLGELGHPTDGKTRLSNVSHLITKVWMEEGYKPECAVCKANGGPHTHVMAEEEALNTPEGKILQELYRAGVQLGVSSRGQGSVRGGNEEQLVSDDFRLETFDHVLDPSTPGAYPKVISESVINAVERLVEPACSAAELQGYRKILAEVRTGESIDSQSSIDSMIETIDVRIASGDSPKIFPVSNIPIIGETSTSTPMVLVPASAVSVSTPDDVTTNTPLRSDDEVAEDKKMQELSLEHPEVQTLVRREVEKVREELENRLAEAVAQIDKLRAENSEADEKIVAADKVGEELVSQLKNARFHLGAFKAEEGVEMAPTGPEMYDEDHTLEQAFDASKEVIEELLQRLEFANESVERAEAAEALLAETIERVRRRGTVEKIDNILANESEELSKRLRPLLAECRSVEEVSQRFETLKGLVNEEVSAPQAPAVEEAVEVKSDGSLPTAVTEISEQSLAGDAAFAIAEEANTVNQDLSRRILRRTLGA